MFYRTPAGDAALLVEQRHDTDADCTAARPASIVAAPAAPNDTGNRVVSGLDLEAPATRGLNGEDTLLSEVNDRDGRAVVAATRSLPRLDWGLTVTTPRDELLAPVRRANRIIGAMLGLTALLSLGLAWTLARMVAQPVVRLREAVNAVRGGDLDVRADANAPAELGELGAAFNEMTTAIRRNQADLEQRYRDLEVLTHAMAHDLKNPLTVTRGTLELLEGGRALPPEDEQRLVANAAGAARRMQRLIDDLLALTRALGAELQHDPVDLEELVGRVSGELDLDTAVDCDTLPTILGDPVLLEQLIINLLTNAATYVRPGSTPRIRVSAVLDEGWCTLHVDDAGIGIPPEERTAVLQAFYRGEQTRDHRGSGLGLSIVHRVAERHGGSVELTDSPLGGTRVAVRLAMNGVHALGSTGEDDPEAAGDPEAADGPEAAGDPEAAGNRAARPVLRHGDRVG